MMDDTDYAKNENVPRPFSTKETNTCLKCDRKFTFRCIYPDDPKAVRTCPNCKRSNSFHYDWETDLYDF